MKIETWDSRSSFSYTGCVSTGTCITYGNNNNTVTITQQQYVDLITNFLGQVVKIGTSFTNPQQGSMGEWFKANITQTAVASYVASILIREGYVIREMNEIRFIRTP